MELIATRKKEKDISYVLVRNIILASISLLMAGLCLFAVNPPYIVTTIIGLVFVFFALLFVIFGIKDFKFNKRINKLPDEALCKHYSKLVICNEEETTINLKDIQDISCRRYIKTSFGLVQYISREGVIKITTTEKTYKIENVEEVKEVTKILNNLIKND